MKNSKGKKRGSGRFVGWGGRDGSLCSAHPEQAVDEAGAGDTGQDQDQTDDEDDVPEDSPDISYAIDREQDQCQHNPHDPVPGSDILFTTLHEGSPQDSGRPDAITLSDRAFL